MNFLQVCYPDKPARFFINGKRVAKYHFEQTVDNAYDNGTYKPLSTKAIPIGTQFKRYNYSIG